MALLLSISIAILIIVFVKRSWINLKLYNQSNPSNNNNLLDNDVYTIMITSYLI